MKIKLITVVLMSVCSYACSDNQTKKETEELENVDALIEQDRLRLDSAKEALDSIYK